MTAFSQLPALLQGALCLLVFLTTLLFVYSLLRIARNAQGLPMMAWAVMGALSCYTLLQLLLGKTAESLGAVWCILSAFALFFASINLAYRSRRYSAAHIEAAAIKESVDSLPVGVCCYWPGGLVKLVNESMETLSYAVTGSAPLNGESLWNELERGEGRAVFLQVGENPVVRLDDKSVWSFRRESVKLDCGTIYELLATDLTEEYAVNAELTEKRARVSEFNRRLRELNREIERMTVEKEVLAAKVSIHDELGRALLYAKQYYRRPETGDRETLLRIWGEAIRFLMKEGPEHWRDLYAYADQVASELGVTIAVDGALPQGGRVKELFSDALITCLSNAARHGGADEMYVTARETETAHILRVSNNGTAPESGVVESGGLRNLREKVERAGGTMREETTPAFTLVVEIPKEETNDPLSSADRGRPAHGTPTL